MGLDPALAQGLRVVALMNIVAVIVFLLIGFLSDWGDAFWFLFGYLLAFVIAGWMWRDRI